ncbi:unnamed protein product, partial [Ectocarpus sp. 13 AM-2016]
IPPQRLSVRHHQPPDVKNSSQVLLALDEAWTPRTTVKQMLQAIYEFLDHPDP